MMVKYKDTETWKSNVMPKVTFLLPSIRNEGPLEKYPYRVCKLGAMPEKTAEYALRLIQSEMGSKFPESTM